MGFQCSDGFEKRLTIGSKHSITGCAPLLIISCFAANEERVSYCTSLGLFKLLGTRYDLLGNSEGPVNNNSKGPALPVLGDLACN